MDILEGLNESQLDAVTSTEGYIRVIAGAGSGKTRVLFNRMEIKDALSYLRMVVYKDDLSFTRIINVPKRNIGKRRMAALTEYAESNSSTLYEALLALCDTELFKSTGARDFIN